MRALDCFHRSEQRYPRATLMVGYVHFQSGRLRQAVDSIHQYLATPDAQNRTALEVWVKHAERQLAGLHQTLSRVSHFQVSLITRVSVDW